MHCLCIDFHMKFVSFQGSREDLGHVFWLQPTLSETNDLEGKTLYGCVSL